MPSRNEPSEFLILSSLLATVAGGLFMAGCRRSGLTLLVLAVACLIGDFFFGIKRK